MDPKKRDINIKTTNKTHYEQSTQSTSSARPKPIDREKLQEVDHVESIGLYDDFSSLKIALNTYSQQDGEYGIPFKKSVHDAVGAARVLDHQREAAELFLSDLRGFGLLADCVGSGKTYEACVVISELAVRGRIENLLIIVPDDALLGKWTGVVEMEFGFGKGKLHKIERLDELKGAPVTEDGYRKPAGAYIMTYAAFTSSGKEMIAGTLFDLIVVDEAHNLCKVTKKEMTSMYYLSLMMQTKKKCDKPFCLLLTATPHSGNLAHMFNLWYFIRCKGGIPECFRENGTPDRADIAEYEAEKKYYTDVVCKGATTVAEYIAKAECDYLVGMRGAKSERRDKFFAAFTTTVYKSDGTRMEVPFEEIDYDGYLALKECQKKSRARAFLEIPANHDIKSKTLDYVNELYTNVVMRSIMVRRRNKYSLKRRAYSYFFLPIDKVVPIEGVKERKAPVFMIDGEPLTADSVAEVFAKEEYEAALFEKNEHFIKNGGAGRRGFAAFYAKVFDSISEKTPESDKEKSDFLRVEQVACSVAAEEEAVFLAKCKRFVALLDELRSRHGNHRVIVFFDYKKEENAGGEEDKATWTKLKNYLIAQRPEYQKDLVEGKGDDLEGAIKAYEGSPDAILFAEDPRLTEGQDLQSGNVVVNFEIPVDPLTVDQRIGRVCRLGQVEDDVEIHSFATMSRLDGYCLGYFATIGILSDTEGDATILSGCNSDNMKVLRCSACNDVTLMYESDYEETLPECEECKAAGVTSIKMEPLIRVDQDGVRKEVYVCKRDASHVTDIPADDILRCTCENAPVREPIVINEFVCSKHSTHRIRRAKDKGYNYVCMSYKRNNMLRRQDEKNNVLVGCSKFCAFKNCPYVDSKCELRRVVDNITTEEEARVICSACDSFEHCDCRIDNCDRPKDKSVTNSCAVCRLYKRSGRPFRCGMQPYTINFGKDYEDGQCPICGARIEQIRQNTFETFILGRYEHDHSFANNFLREMDNTLVVKDILRFN